MRERIAKIFKGQIISSIIYILLGLCLVLMPVGTVYVICKVMFGIVLILTGCYHVVIYLMEKRNATVMDMFSGVILVVFGGFLFFNPQIVMKLLPILLGAFLLIDSIWSLQGAFRLKKRQRGMWKVLLIGSLAFIGLGAALIVNPFQNMKYTFVFAGAGLLANGVLDVVFMILLRVGMKEKEEKAEEPEKTEEPQTAASDVQEEPVKVMQEEKEEDRPVFERWMPFGAKTSQGQEVAVEQKMTVEQEDVAEQKMTAEQDTILEQDKPSGKDDEREE